MKTQCNIELAEWEDECSQFNPGGYYCFGNECYFSKFKKFVPERIFLRWGDEDEDSVLFDWLDSLQDLKDKIASN